MARYQVKQKRSPGILKPHGPGEADLHSVAQTLHTLYGSPHHGNKADPLDELIYIHLSRRTRSTAYQKAFDRLKSEFPRWSDLLEAPPAKLRRIIRPCGMANIRTRSIRQILRTIKDRFGRVSLTRIRRWANHRITKLLTSLPGVELKSALCVMMYSLKRDVFPADTHCIRVLERIGFIPPRMHHDDAQELLLERVPGNLSYVLHTNLIEHGRRICTSRNPRCSICDIRKFCAYYRRRKEENAERAKRPLTIDVFCGAGGTSEGFKQAGFDVALAIDNDPWAVESYRLNHPDVPGERVWLRDLERVDPEEVARSVRPERIAVVVGGPPCQGFSMIGKRVRGLDNHVRFIDDPRNRLYREFVKIVEAVRPQFFVMENVPGIFSAKGGKYKKQIIQDLSRFYAVDCCIINAVDFGVPQHRRRVIFVGSRIQGGARDRADRRVRAIVDALKSRRLPPEEHRTLWDAITDLPSLKAGGGANFMVYPPLKAYRTYSDYLLTLRNGNRVLFNHDSRPLMQRDIELYRLLRPGEWAIHAITRYNRPDLMIYSQDGFEDKYKKQSWSQPCSTLVAHLSQDGHMFIHPDRRQGRSITVREAARLQSFPDDYIFAGPRTSQFRHVGNAVPPILAEAVALEIMAHLRGSSCSPSAASCLGAVQPAGRDA